MNIKIASVKIKKFQNSLYRYLFTSSMFLKRLKNSIFHNIIDTLFPETCCGCGQHKKIKKYCFCDDCFARIIPAPGSNNQIFSLARYEGPVQKAIHMYKYERKKWLSRSFAEWMNDFLSEHTEIEFDIIIPVPLHMIREFQRSFNQSWLIAYYLGRMKKKLVIYDALVKVKNNPSQTGLDHQKRKENVQGVYIVKKQQMIKGKKILVIDDVCTTGATVEEIYKTLKNSGAKKVTILTIARA